MSGTLPLALVIVTLPVVTVWLSTDTWTVKLVSKSVGRLDLVAQPTSPTIEAKLVRMRPPLMHISRREANVKCVSHVQRATVGPVCAR